MLVSALVLMDSKDPLIFFMFPAFLLVAFRLGLPGTVVNIFLFTLMTIGFTIKGYGPLMLIVGEHMLLHRIVIAQVFAAVAIFTMFPVAAVLEEKETLKNSLAASEARYRRLAYVDELTGLPNRRAFNLQLENAWADAIADSKDLALLILDADLFKQYNDCVGHLGGDACLHAIAQVTASIVEAAKGFAARIGGEEFAVILPGATQLHALRGCRRDSAACRRSCSRSSLQPLWRTNPQRRSCRLRANEQPCVHRPDEVGRRSALFREDLR